MITMGVTSSLGMRLLYVQLACKLFEVSMIDGRGMTDAIVYSLTDLHGNHRR